MSWEVLEQFLQEDIYEEDFLVLSDPARPDYLQVADREDAFAELHGDKVSKKDIESQFEAMTSRYQTEEEFDNALKASGLTQKTFKTQLKSTLVYRVG